MELITNPMRIYKYNKKALSDKHQPLRIITEDTVYDLKCNYVILPKNFNFKTELKPYESMVSVESQPPFEDYYFINLKSTSPYTFSKLWDFTYRNENQLNLAGIYVQLVSDSWRVINKVMENPFSGIFRITDGKDKIHYGAKVENKLSPLLTTNKNLRKAFEYKLGLMGWKMAWIFDKDECFYIEPL